MEKLNLKQITTQITEVIASKIAEEIIEKSETSHREYYYDENVEQLQDSYHYISSYTYNGDDNIPTITVDTHWLIDIKDLDGSEDISMCKSWSISHYTLDIA